MVDDVVPFVDAHLATVAAPKGRVLAGFSAGGFGAVYIALRHPGLFGAVESWSGYFHPLRDGPFKHDTTAQLRANDPAARSVAADCATACASSSRPGRTTRTGFKPAETRTFAGRCGSRASPCARSSTTG